MSELDTLHGRSLSGVNMRPKIKPPDPTAAEIVGAAMSQLANVLAVNQEAMTKALVAAVAAKPAADVLTSELESDSAPAPKAVKFSFTKNADGSITQGTVSNGDHEWSVSFSRSDGRLDVSMTAIK